MQAAPMELILQIKQRGDAARLVSWGGMLESLAPLTQLTGSFTISAQPDSCKAYVSTIVPCCKDKGVHGTSSRVVRQLQWS